MSEQCIQIEPPFVADTPEFESMATGNLSTTIAFQGLNKKRTEALALNWWRDPEAVAILAGRDIEDAWYFPANGRHFITRSKYVRHCQCKNVWLGLSNDETTPPLKCTVGQ